MNHWDTFYVSGSVPEIPSQFAVFIANEFPSATNVIDAGCGNGRDSMFFARQGKRVIGFDKCETAIGICKAKADGKARFIAAPVDDPTLWDRLPRQLPDDDNPLVVYARFFLHAIPQDEEASLIEGVARLLDERPGVFCIECRTTQDQAGPKVTADHYRRFIDPADLRTRLEAAGFRIDYSVQGHGMAKFKEDDAHVVRVIASRA